MRELRLGLRLGPVTDQGSPRLEVLAVRARRNLAVRLLAREPYFQVVRLRRRKAHVARAESHRSIWELEELEYLLGVLHHFFELVVGLLLLDDLDELDLLELVK